MTAAKNDPPKDTRTRYITVHRACPPHIQKALKVALLEFDEIDIDVFKGNTTVLSAGAR